MKGEGWRMQAGWYVIHGEVRRTDWVHPKRLDSTLMSEAQPEARKQRLLRDQITTRGNRLYVRTG